MSTDTKILMSEGGTEERTVKAGQVVIPDLWHIAMRMEQPAQRLVLETWHLANDLLKHIQGTPDELAAGEAVVEAAGRALEAATPREPNSLGQVMSSGRPITHPDGIQPDTWEPKVGDSCHKYVNGDRYAMVVMWVSQAGTMVQARRCDVFVLDRDIGKFCFQDDPNGEMVMFTKRTVKVRSDDGPETETRFVVTGQRFHGGTYLRPGWDEYQSREF